VSAVAKIWSLILTDVGSLQVLCRCLLKYIMTTFVAFVASHFLTVDVGSAVFQGVTQLK